MEQYLIKGRRVKLPSGWHDVPFYKGLKILRESPDQIGILAILLDKTRKEISALSDPDSLRAFADAFTFIQRMPRNITTPEMPYSVNFRGTKMIIPKVIYGDPFDLGRAQVGAVEDMKATIANMTRDYVGEPTEDEEPRLLTEWEVLSIMPSVVAIYFDCLEYGKEYDYDRAMRSVPDVEKCSFKDIANIGYFFFRRLTVLMSGSEGSLRKPKSMRQRLTQGLIRSISSLVSRPH